MKMITFGNGSIKRAWRSIVCCAFVAFSISNSLSAQTANLKISAIPYTLEVKNTSVSYIINDSKIEITAAGKTNLFNNPNGIYKVQNAPMVLFAPKGDFTLSAKVTGELKSIYDVAALVVYQDENTWAKFCYENSVDKQPTIVSVVTRTYSDDCNSVQADSYAYLAVVRKGQEFSFLYSADKEDWKMIRHFRLDITDMLKVGFAAHGSRGDGFTGTFTEVAYHDKALENMRGD
jgi:Uncharacterized conserved protein